MKNNSVDHLYGLELIYLARTSYDLEIECVCLNSNYQNIEPLIPLAIKLKNEYPTFVVFKESEDHSKENPYYELSLFCNKDNLDKFSQVIKDYGLKIDIIHENKDQWTPYRK